MTARRSEVRAGVADALPLSVYVHLPWCIRKCPYCDFNSHALPDVDDLPEERYLRALRADLDGVAEALRLRPVQTIFLGGGTPSLFSPESIEAVLTMLRSRLTVAADAEVTMEANPGTFDAGRFRAYRQAGVTRLSIGVQSFDDEFLRRIGRVHDAAQACRAIEVAAQHYETWNIDLMHALPGQELTDVQADLRLALSFAPPHLSCYQLTIEPETAFAIRPPAVPDDDDSAAMHDWIGAQAQRCGLDHYEVSAYARAGHRCAHNLNYWQFGDYLGLGAGAHGKLSFADRILREERVRDPRKYMQAALAGNPLAQSRALCVDELPFEFMLNALRLHDGVPVASFRQRTGLSPQVMAAAIDSARTRGLMADDADRWRASERGWRFLNDLQSLFLPDPAQS